MSNYQLTIKLPLLLKIKEGEKGKKLEIVLVVERQHVVRLYL